MDTAVAEEEEEEEEEVAVAVDSEGVSSVSAARAIVVDSGCRHSCNRRLEPRFTGCFGSGIAGDS